MNLMNYCKNKLMKSTIFIGLLAVIILTSCEKEDKTTSTNPVDTNNTTNSSLLAGDSSKFWKLKKLYLNGENIFSWLDSCYTDDLMKLYADKSYEMDEGKTKCNPSDEQIFDKGTWSLSENGDILSLRSDEGISDASILELTENTLKLRTTEDSSTFDMHYVNYSDSDNGNNGGGNNGGGNNGGGGSEPECPWYLTHGLSIDSQNITISGEPLIINECDLSYDFFMGEGDEWESLKFGYQTGQQENDRSQFWLLIYESQWGHKIFNNRTATDFNSPGSMEVHLWIGYDDTHTDTAEDYEEHHSASAGSVEISNVTRRTDGGIKTMTVTFNNLKVCDFDENETISIINGQANLIGVTQQ